jgi:hypothetical protein
LLALLLRFVSCPEVVAESRTVLVETAVVLFLFRFLIFDFFEDFEKLFFSSEAPHLKAGDDDHDEHDLQVDRLTIYSDF